MDMETMDSGSHVTNISNNLALFTDSLDKFDNALDSGSFSVGVHNTDSVMYNSFDHFCIREWGDLQKTKKLNY
jgi:hypothetical protein